METTLYSKTVGVRVVGQLRERPDSGNFPACITLTQSAGPTGTGDARPGDQLFANLYLAQSRGVG